MLGGASALMAIVFGAHRYDCYEIKGDKYVSIGSIETQFHAQRLELTALKVEALPQPMDRSGWPKAEPSGSPAPRPSGRQRRRRSPATAAKDAAAGSGSGIASTFTKPEPSGT